MSLSPASRPRRKRSDAALCDAAASGARAQVQRMLSQGIDENSVDEDGTSALMAAAFAGELEIVRTLLDAGADPDLQDESGLTALMNAVIAEGEMDLDGGHGLFLEVVELLLDRGADPRLEDEHGFTAAQYADQYGLGESAALLRRR